MMIKRIIFIFLFFILAYVGVVRFQIFVADQSANTKTQVNQEEKKPTHKLFEFSFTKYTPEGTKEIEIEGDSANVLTRTVSLMNVVAKAYAEETPVTITSDTGSYDKDHNKVFLEQNVVATTEDGTRLLTEELEILPTERVMETFVQTEVKKDNINIEGMGARGDSSLKRVRFKKNVTVVVQDPEQDDSDGPTVISCDGPLVIDYEKNIAHFKDNVIAEDTRGKLMADVMDVYYNRVSRKVSKIVAIGHVVIENPDGNRTYSDNVIYLAEEGRIILGGDAEALYYEGDGGGIPEELL